MSKGIKKFIIIFSLLFACFAAVHFTLAADANSVVFGGKEGAISDTIGLGSEDPRVMAAKIIRVALGFLGIIAIGLIIYAGYVWMTAGGNEENIEKAKKILIGAVIGLVIILASFAIATYILNKLLEATGGGGGGGCDPACASGEYCCSGSCQSAPCGATPPGATNFYITSTSPIDKTGITDPDKKVILNAKVRFNFNTAMDAGTVSNSTFKVTDANGDIAGNLATDGSRITFTPSGTCPANPCGAANCLPSNDDITVKAENGASGILSVGDNQLSCGMGQPCEITFKTGETIDCEDPTVNFNFTQVCVSANNNIGANSSDDSAVSYIDFYVNDVFKESQNNPQYSNIFNASFNWDGSGFTVGETVSFKANVYDIDDHVGSDTKTARLKPEHCCNGVKDGDEEGVDCGGECAACVGAACATDKGGAPAASCSDDLCASGFCTSTGSSQASCAQAGYDSSVTSCCLCQSRPRIDWVSPEDGKPGNLITIGGANFGTAAGKVWFGGADANGDLDYFNDGDEKEGLNPITVNAECANYWQNNQIVIVIPTGAEDGPIKVEAANNYEDATNDDFGNQISDFDINNIVKPGLCLANPDSGYFGDTFNLAGIQFSGADRSVKFGATASSIVADGINFTSDKSVNADVPNAQTGGTTVFVAAGGANSNYLRFKVLYDAANAPIIDYIDPAKGPPKQYITIYGSNFKSYNVGASRVIFKDKATNATTTADGFGFPEECQDSWWQNDHIIVKVPDMAPPDIDFGNYDVTIANSNNLTSAPEEFEITNEAPGPGLCEIKPHNGPVNTSIIAYGDNFNNNQGSGFIKFYNNINNAAISNWKNQKIETAVPAGAETGPVAVSNGIKMSNSLPFTVGTCTGNNECYAGEECCLAGTFWAGICRDSGTCNAGAVTACAYGWTFSTGANPTPPPTCGGYTNAEACAAVGTCPNSPGECQTKEDVIMGSGCGNDYCNTAYPTLCSGQCAYDPVLNKCKLTGFDCDAAANEAYFQFVDDNPPDQTFIFKLTDQAKIQEARDILSGRQTGKTHVMGIIKKEPANYNPPWNYYLDPSIINFFEYAVEVCDADIQYVEENLDDACGAFLPGCAWCPWGSRIIKELELDCRVVKGEGIWQINPEGASCPAGTYLDTNGWCTLGTIGNSQTCNLCDSGFSCQNNECVVNKIICPFGSVCDLVSGSTMENKCVSNDICECCCRVNNSAQDCCAGLTCEAGGCGSDPVNYGLCTDCKVEINGAVDQTASDNACNCSGGATRYCVIDSTYPNGACQDRQECDSDPTTSICDASQILCASKEYCDTDCLCKPAELCDSNTSTSACEPSNSLCDAGFACDNATCLCQPKRCNDDLAQCSNPINCGQDEYCDQNCFCQPNGGGAGESCILETEPTCAEGEPNCLAGYSCLNDGDCRCCCTPIMCSDIAASCIGKNEGDVCGTGTCEVSKNTAGLECTLNKEPCGCADPGDCNRGLYCGCSTDDQCGNLDFIGCSFDTCCRARPEITSMSPENGATNICRNTAISATFDQYMDISGLSGNIIVIGDYGTGSCPAGTQYILASESGQKGFFGRVFAGVSQVFKRMANVIFHKAEALSGNFCAIAGAVSGVNNANKTTTLTFYPPALLDANKKYYVIIKGDGDLTDANKAGVKSYYDIAMADDWLDLDNDGTIGDNDDRIFNGVKFYGQVWSFTIRDDLNNNGVCAIDRVKINPASYLFQTTDDDLNENDADASADSFDTAKDSDKLFIVRALSSNGLELSSINGVYSWTWDWTTSNSGAADFASSVSNLLDNSKLVEAVSGITDGQTDITAKAVITAGGGGPYAAVAPVWVFVCANPWPAVGAGGIWSPWQESGSNCTVADSGNCSNTNYNIYYCRDAGGAGTVDDLPAIISDDTIIRGSSTLQNFLKEFYFFREEVPAASSDLSLVNQTTNSNGKIYANWDEIIGSGIEGYKIYYGAKSNNYDNYKTVSGSSNTSLLVSGLTVGKTYYFNITALYPNAVESAHLGEKSIEVKDTGAPASPANLQTTKSCEGKIDIKWATSTTSVIDEVAGYKVYYGAISGQYGGAENAGDALEAALTGLTNGNTYYIAVSAYDSTGNESAKAEINSGQGIVVSDSCQ